MNAIDYILDAVLLATIFLQFRGRRLTVRYLVLPVAIVVYFLFAYLKGVPTAGNDLYLIAGGVALGLIFGVGAGAFTRVYPGEKGIYAKAGCWRPRSGPPGLCSALRSACTPATAVHQPTGSSAG
jgi:hypothetical protein